MATLALLGSMLAVVQTGCTALLGSSGLQDMLVESNEPSVEAVYTSDDANAGVEPESTTDQPDQPPQTKADAAAIAEEAFDAAIQRLDDAGRLDPATQEALETALEDAPRHDWPVIIDAFVATLEAAPRPKRTVLRPVDATSVAMLPESPKSAISAAPTAVAATPASAEGGHPAPEAPPSPPEATSPVRIETPSSPDKTSDTTPEKTVPPADAAAPVATPAAPAAPEARLAIVNACFASRVRGWGDVDRFSTSLFATGQEVIVYFELEDLAAVPSEAGHTTRIDTALQLVSADGRPLHQWRFEPIEETCPTPRRDYFARYVVRIPADVPAGQCRLDLAVTDTVGHCTASATLPLEVADR